MASSGIPLITCIGLLMGISPGSAGQSQAATAAPEPVVSRQHPVLGFYVIEDRGKAVLHCPPDTPPLSEKLEYPMLTLEGEAGTLQNLKLAPKVMDKVPDQGQPIPQILYDLCNKRMQIYTGDQKQIPRRVDGPDFSLGGILLPPGTRIQKSQNKGEFLLATEEKKFYIKACTGMEGPRFSCLSYPARVHLCQYYYYVGYDTEEDCEPEPVKP